LRSFLIRSLRYLNGRTLSPFPTEAEQFYQHAIQLDPDFALAYTSLGVAYDNLGEVNKAAENLTKAYSLRDRVSERERYRITAMYHSDVTGDLEKDRETCELWKQTYPRDMAARVMLGTVYATLGQLEKSSEQFHEALRLSPESAISYGDSAMTAIALDNLQEAEAALSMAQAKGLDGLIIHENLYSIAFLRGDFGEMKRQVAWAEGRPGSEDQLLAQDSDTEAYYGRLGNARKLTRRAVESAVRGDAKETAAIWEIDGALREMEVGNLSLARQGVRAALSLAPTRDVKVLAALVWAQTGDTVGAKALIRELEGQNPTNTILKSYWLPTLKASLEVRSSNPQAAISLLQVAEPYELGQASYLFNMYPAYLRGEAYMLAQNGAAAEVEFEKLLHHPGIEQNEILGALSRLQLARAKALTKDMDGARKQYRDFLSFWKDADPGIPILMAARTEYAKLQ
jgi:eukaryotic-like serine/threonine-protein kinase